MSMLSTSGERCCIISRSVIRVPAALQEMISQWGAFWCMATTISSCAVPCRTGRLHSHSFDSGLSSGSD